MQSPPAWKTYLKVLLGLLPTLGLWVFSLMVIFPRIELLVKRTGLDAKESSALKFIIELSRFTHNNFYLIALVLGISLLVPEYKVQSWNRLRQPLLHPPGRIIKHSRVARPGGIGSDCFAGGFLASEAPVITSWALAFTSLRFQPLLLQLLPKREA